MKLEEDYSYRRKKKGRQIGFQEVLEIKFYLAELMIVADPSFSKLILYIILADCYKSIADVTTYRCPDHLVEFSADVLKFSVAKLDDIIANNSVDAIKNTAIRHFGGIWEYLSEKIKKSGIGYFTRTTTASHRVEGTGNRLAATSWEKGNLLSNDQ